MLTVSSGTTGKATSTLLREPRWRYDLYKMCTNSTHFSSHKLD
jgi:hypothetical protein